MEGEVFSFTSSDGLPPTGTTKPSTTKGLVCSWSCISKDNTHNLLWSFNWDKLKERKIEGFTGEIVVNGYQRTSGGFPMTPIKIEVDLNHDNRNVKKAITMITYANYIYNYTYTLVPIISMTVIYDEMFLPSEKTDAVLEVEGMKLHVNKAFLTFHSDFFSALFSSKFKEGQMSVIPIEDVTYEEIGLLFSAFYPKAVFPNDKTVPKLLELADRFLVPSVIHHVEYHLLNNTKIENEKLTWMADRYGMELLLEKMIKQLDTVTKVKDLKMSSDYAQLSDKTKLRVLDKVMCII